MPKCSRKRLGQRSGLARPRPRSGPAPQPGLGLDGSASDVAGAPWGVWRGFLDLLQQAPALEAVDHGEPLGVLRDGAVVESLPPGGLHHLGKGLATVGGGGMAVQVAVQIGHLDQVG
jgi:hypothetical protein